MSRMYIIDNSLPRRAFCFRNPPLKAIRSVKALYPKKLGPGDLWLQSVDLLGVESHPAVEIKKPQEEVICEMWMTIEADPNPDDFFAPEDTYQLFVAITIPIDSGLDHSHRSSPIIVVETQLGDLKNDTDAPSWAKWTPGKAIRFVDLRDGVVAVIGLLSAYRANKRAEAEIWSWAAAASVGTAVQPGFSLESSATST
ncbi:hypothetical protein NEOLEDRAFT_1152842 [Neolentinus lepideus HHB14362 ss-1]|uniref:Uncharacterized protein n=1 Tax=Neolentinus lepideus HHB14362 ss-1 TaxID=1314782 RepID=A0A165M6V2_9AGAM|nr:hypothetical protein NEOLEDRAFT_1152842 [Neolentinus lepideus HHB14362 ss-1]